MIYGKTLGQWTKERELQRKKKAVWKHKFAWFPVTISDGRTLWLGYYWIRYLWKPYRYNKDLKKVVGGYYIREIRINQEGKILL